MVVAKLHQAAKAQGVATFRDDHILVRVDLVADVEYADWDHSVAFHGIPRCASPASTPLLHTSGLCTIFFGCVRCTANPT